MSTSLSPRNGSLAGIRVIEFCQVAAGPFCGMLLSDFGADVIKVEGPQGDTMREWPPHNAGYSENFASVNRNKRSIAIDLKAKDGQDQARALVRSADVVIENNRPGVMHRLGLDYGTLSVPQPRLIYCSISAFGQSGPRSQEGGFDLTIQGIAGVMSVTGEPDGAPVKCGVPISDFASGLYAALSVASALRQVAIDGKGMHIDVSMMAATMAIAALQTSEYFGTGLDPRKLGSAHPRNAPYQAFKARNGYFVMAAGNNKLFGLVCEAIGRPDLLGDPRFANTNMRAKNQAALKIAVETFCSNLDSKDAVDLFQSRGIPCGPINTYSEAVDDPQIAFQGFVQPLELPGGAHTRTFGSPILIDGSRLPVYRRPPGLNENAREIMDEIKGAAS